MIKWWRWYIQYIYVQHTLRYFVITVEFFGPGDHDRSSDKMIFVFLGEEKVWFCHPNILWEWKTLFRSKKIPIFVLLHAYVMLRQKVLVNESDFRDRDLDEMCDKYCEQCSIYELMIFFTIFTYIMDNSLFNCTDSFLCIRHYYKFYMVLEVFYMF